MIISEHKCLVTISSTFRIVISPELNINIYPMKTDRNMHILSANSRLLLSLLDHLDARFVSTNNSQKQMKIINV